MNSRLFGKVPDAGKDWGQKEKRVLEDEMAGWHHRCNGHELGQTSGDGEGQGGLVCCRTRGVKELDVIGRLNDNRNKIILHPKIQSKSYQIYKNKWPGIQLWWEISIFLNKFLNIQEILFIFIHMLVNLFWLYSPLIWAQKALFFIFLFFFQNYVFDYYFWYRYSIRIFGTIFNFSIEFSVFFLSSMFLFSHCLILAFPLYLGIFKTPSPPH